MKIIDDKGRLFGIINIFDLAVLVIVILLIPMGYFGYVIYKKTHLRIQKNEVKSISFSSDVNCLFFGVHPNIVKKIRIGDMEKDEHGEVIARLKGFKQPQPYTEKLNLNDHESILLVNSNLQQIPAAFQMKLFIKENKVYYKNLNNEIKIDSLITFETSKYKLACKIKEGKKKIISSKWISLKARFFIMPEIAKIIKDGDMDWDESKGQLKVESVLSSKSWNVVSPNENYQEVVLSMKLRCIIENNDCYYDNSLVRIGRNIQFTSDIYSITGTIIGIN